MTSIARKPRIFYGWYIVAISSMGALFGAGTSQLFMSVMLKPITEDMGWSRTELAAATTMGTVLSGLASPMVGRWADRHGPRFLMAFAVVAVALSFLALGAVQLVWQFYFAYVFGRVASSTTLSGVVSRTAVVNWFRRMRGRALGMVATAVPLGGSVLAVTAQTMMGQGMTWRGVFVVFSVATLAVLLIPTVLLMRKQPEDVGLLPDGDTREQAARAAAEDRGARGRGAERSYTLRQAMRTPTLWLLIFSMSFSSWGNGGLSFHLVAYYTDAGIAAGLAVAALSTYALSGAVANTMWGFLTERHSERALAMGAMALAAALTVFALVATNVAGAFTFAMLFGLAARGEASLINIMLAQYYGRGSFGAISGFATPFQMAGLGIGPTVSAFIYDMSGGSYTFAFLLSTCLFISSAVMVFLARWPAPAPPAA